MLTSRPGAPDSKASVQIAKFLRPCGPPEATRFYRMAGRDYLKVEIEKLKETALNFDLDLTTSACILEI